MNAHIDRYQKPDSEGSGQDAEENETDALVANRSGSVLGPHTILKEDHFPGVQSPKLPTVVVVQAIPSSEALDDNAENAPG